MALIACIAWKHRAAWKIEIARLIWVVYIHSLVSLDSRCLDSVDVDGFNDLSRLDILYSLEVVDRFINLDSLGSWKAWIFWIFCTVSLATLHSLHSKSSS